MNKARSWFYEKTYELVRWVKKRDKTQTVTIWNEKEDTTTDPRYRKFTREYLQFYADTFEILDKMERFLEDTIYQN